MDGEKPPEGPRLTPATRPISTPSTRASAKPRPIRKQALIAFEDGERLRRAIADLPSPLLETLIMRDVNGLSYRDIAEATGAPMGTVMSRLARARASLMKTLKAEP